jgi:isopentenyl diphosphate isomerase/L-lactate dehydrogenase-like FMN-dependent dehydrogenase
MTLDRRQAVGRLLRFALASPLVGSELLRAQAPAESDAALLDLVNVWDFARLAQKKLDPVAWDYMAEGSEDEITLRDNRAAFNRILLRPRWLTDVHKIDLTTTLLGKALEFPIFIDPAGGKNCFVAEGELKAARGAAAMNAMMITNGGIDDFLTSGHGPKNWWQVTTGGEFRNKNTMLSFVEKLEDMGCSGICFTVDIMHVSQRERSMHHKFVRSWCNDGIPRDAQGNLIYKEGDVIWRPGVYPSRPFPTPTWDTVRELRELTELPILIKGVLTAEDSEKCVATGMSGIVVSNHGARQNDHVGGTIEALPECVKAAGGKIPVLVDGGFRRGTDVLKALALGASAVGIARPYLWGLTCFGERGVARILELLKTELALNMGMNGVAKISDIDRKLVRIRDWGEVPASP